MLILVTGTRHATIADHGLIVQRAVLDLAATEPGPHTIYVGHAPGVDFIVDRLLRRRPHPAHRGGETPWAANVARDASCGPRRSPSPPPRWPRSGTQATSSGPCAVAEPQVLTAVLRLETAQVHPGDNARGDIGDVTE